jgi:hypothetical protein
MALPQKFGRPLMIESQAKPIKFESEDDPNMPPEMKAALQIVKAKRGIQ